jgi:hypothetical protein
MTLQIIDLVIFRLWILVPTRENVVCKAFIVVTHENGECENSKDPPIKMKESVNSSRMEEWISMRMDNSYTFPW